MLTAEQHEKRRAELGQRIRLLRKERGLSQEAFADICGLHRTYVGGVERGEYNIALDNLHKIAAALRVDITVLFAR